MAVGGFLLRRLLLVATLLPLALRLQEVKADGTEPEGEGQQGSNPEPNSGEPAGKSNNNTTDAEEDQVDGNSAQANDTDSEPDPLMNEDVNSGNYSSGSNATSKTDDCPAECEDWKFEVLAECEQKLMGFDNLCYYYQYKCNKPEAECRFHCCLYRGTNVTTASKFDCDDICRL